MDPVQIPGDTHRAEALGALATEAQFNSYPEDGTTLGKIAGENYEKGHYVLAEVLYRRALVVLRRGRNGVASAENLLTVENNLALAINDQGRYQEAQTLYETVLEKQERLLGSDHPNTLATRHNLRYIEKLEESLRQVESLN